MSEELLNKQTDRHPTEKGMIRCQKGIIVCKLISQIGLAVLQGNRLQTDLHTSYHLFFISAKYGLYSLEVYEI